MKFNEAEEKFRGLKARFAAGHLTEPDFKAQLEELMVEDEGGSWWMLGYETERWYRYDGTSWVQADPPGMQQPEPPAAVEAARAAPAIPAARRSSPAILGLAALLVLVIGGYFVFRSSPAKSTLPTPTAAPVQPVAVKPSETPAPTATAEPSRTPTPEAAFQVTASASQVVMYGGPDLRYGQVGNYAQGTEFTVLARDADAHWLLVTAPDGSEGWLYFQWVAADFDLSLLPTPSVVPPPPPTATRKPRQSTSKPTPCTFGC
jgi:hypothetical protein